MEKFDYKAFSEKIKNQTIENIPSDINKESREYVSNVVESYVIMALEALVNDNSIDFTNKQMEIFGQILAKQIFNKSIDLIKSSVSLIDCDIILPQIAFGIFETLKKGFINNLTEDEITKNVETTVTECWTKAIKNLSKDKEDIKRFNENIKRFSKNKARCNILQLIYAIINRLLNKKTKEEKTFQTEYPKYIAERLQNAPKYIAERLQNAMDEENPYGFLNFGPVTLQLSEDLAELSNPDLTGYFSTQIQKIKENLLNGMGYYIAFDIPVYPMADLGTNGYRILINDKVIYENVVYKDKYCVWGPEWRKTGKELPENAIKHPNADCYWLDLNDIKNFDFIEKCDALSLIRIHLSNLLIKEVDSVLSTYDIKKYFELLKEYNPQNTTIDKLIENMDLGTIRQVFVNLIKEHTYIEDKLYFLEKLYEYSQKETDPEILSKWLKIDFNNQ